MDNNRLPLDIENRVRIWEEAFLKAYEYVLLLDYDYAHSEYVTFKFGKKIGSIHRKATTNSALINAAAVLYTSVFSTGYLGKDIASNRDTNVESIRDKIVHQTKNELGWPEPQFNQLHEKIISSRDNFLAHYDGDKGDYKKEAVGIHSRKMVGLNLVGNEIQNFRELLNVITGITHQIAYQK